MITFDTGAQLAFSNMGLFIGEEGWIHPEANLSTYELIFILKGNVFLEEDGKNFDLKEGDLVCLKPGLTHKGTKKSDNASFFWLHFWAKNYEEFGVYESFVTDAYNCSQLFTTLNHMAMTGADKLLIECRLASFLLELKANNTMKNKLFADIREYIRVNISNALSVRDIAQVFCYNADYLSKLFIRFSGLPLKKYLDNERSAYIKNMLLTTTLTLKEIAAQTGFEDDNTLIKFFKRNNSCTPSQFRNSYYASHTNKK